MPTKRLIAVAGVTLLTCPAFALADQPSDPGNSAFGHSHRPAVTQADPPGPDAPAGEKAKAYGRYCQDQSKKKSEGQKRTPFSECVTAMAKLASGETSSTARACAKLSRKKSEGQKRTPYSKCRAAAAKLRGDR